MKQLELEITINQEENNYELIAKPKDSKDSMLFGWYMGATRAEVINRFVKSMCNNNMKYWFMLQDK